MPLDERIRSLLERRVDPENLELLSVDALRERARGALERWKNLGVTTPAVSEVQDIELEFASGTMPVRVYQPFRPSENGRPAIVVYLHGGGWVVCDLDTHDGICRAICNAAGATVVSIGYRAAPEHPLPGPIEDALEGALWARQQLDPLGRSCIFLAGDSAGGNIAAVSALKLRDRPTITLAGQILLYPVTDSPDAGHASMEEFKVGDAYGQNHALYCRYVQLYLSGANSRDPNFAPLRSPSVAGAAPALVITAEFDMLRDEGEAYARHLTEAGVDVRHVRVEGVNHGYLHLIGYLPAADATIGLIRDWIRERCKSFSD